ncbi:MAG: CcdB family protein [Casimicrobiaceae bacterium]
MNTEGRDAENLARMPKSLKNELSPQACNAHQLRIMRMIRAVRLPMLTTTAKCPALRKATNLSVNSVLLAEAKRLKLNLSQVLETSLTQAVRENSGGKAISRLNPVFAIDGKELVMLTPELAGVPRKSLGEKMGNLTPQRTEIVAALDLVCTGI